MTKDECINKLELITEVLVSAGVYKSAEELQRIIKFIRENMKDA
jgi:hypothetical protein